MLISCLLTCFVTQSFLSAVDSGIKLSIAPKDTLNTTQELDDALDSFIIWGICLSTESMWLKGNLLGTSTLDREGTE